MYDLTRADEPKQKGTPLNKASLLTDAVAAAFGLGTSAVPNDTLNILKKAVLAQVTGKYTKHTTIGELPVGKTVTFNVSGAVTEFRKVQQGKPSSLYDDSCDGAWMIPVNALAAQTWATSAKNSYKESYINTYLNGDFLSMLDANVRSAIKQVKIPYVNGTGSAGSVASGANGLPCKAFLLSGYELGWTTSDNSALMADGAKLGYFEAGNGESAKAKRVAKYNGSAVYLWTRSPPSGEGNRALFVVTDGGYSFDNVAASHNILPAFILPSDYPYTFYTDADGNVYTEQEYTTILTDVLGNEVNAGARVEVGSYVGTGTSGSSGPNTLSFSFSPKFVFIIQGDANGGQEYWSVFVYGAPYGAGGKYYSSGLTILSQATTWGGKSMSWYIYNAGTTSGVYDISNSPFYQLNSSGMKYYYVAIG